MRTDVQINQKGQLRLPNIPIISPGKKPYATRGDFIEYEHDGPHLGRVIGTVKNPDDGEMYLCCVVFMGSGVFCERWILPDDVYNCFSIDEAFLPKINWFFGNEFLNTSSNKARRVFELLYDDLTSK